MKKILVPVDFSPASEAAAEWAASFAKDLGASLYLLHVYTEPAPVMEGGIPVVAIAVELGKELRLRTKTKAGMLAEKYGIPVRGEAIPGFTGDTINETADEWGADVVCLGRKARKHNPLFGSTVLKAIRKTAVPVLVIPEGALYRKPHNVVLALDFKEMLSNACVLPLFTLVKAVDASLSVLHIEKAGAEMPPSEVAEKLQAGLVLSKATYVYEKLESDEVEAGVLEFLDKHPTDMLTMIAHHHGLVARLLVKSHTPQLAFAVNIPLLILKSRP